MVWLVLSLNYLWKFRKGLKAVTPIIMNIAMRRGMFNNYPSAAAPFQVFLVGLSVVFSTPLCCAIFEQQANISVSKLEPHLRDIVQKKYPKVKEVVFNKGL